MADPAGHNHAWLPDALDRYETRLVRYAMTITGDLESARDVVQDAFLRLCENGSPPSTDDERLAPWLFAVCRNRAIDVRKKNSRMQSLIETKQQALKSVDKQPDATASDAEQSGHLLAMVGGLPQRQQEALRLRFAEQMSYRQISEVLGTSVGNVGYLIHAAISALREKMSDTRQKKM